MTLSVLTRGNCYYFQRCAIPPCLGSPRMSSFFQQMFSEPLLWARYAHFLSSSGLC